MAIKMMTTSYISSKIDRQYFDDNMLTDEDFHFDPDQFLNISMHERENTEVTRNMQMDMHENHITPFNEDHQTLNLVEGLDLGNIDDLLRDCLGEGNIKMEPLSPYSNGVPSPENDVSVISIPEESSSCGVIEVITDTPPQTPPGLLERVSNSPPKSSPYSPIMVSLTSVPTLTYIVPPLPPQAPPVKMHLNIQPKPEANSEMDTSVEVKKTSDSDEVVQLPNGIFRMKEPFSKAKKSLKTPPITLRTALNPVKKDGCKTSLFETSTAAIKRQERIIKNRESAYLSRKRKKEHVQKLEEELKKVATENSSLREENTRLKIRLSALEKEVLTLRAAFTSKGMQKTLCLMAVVCMFTFNIASYGSVFQKAIMKNPKTDLEPSHRLGRILLWDEENTTKEINNSSKPMLHDSFLKEDEDSPYIVSWDQSYNSSSCQQFINKSESLRLENDLLGWVKRVEKKQKLKEKKMNKYVVDLKNSIVPLPKLQQLGLRYRNGNNKDVWAKRKNQNEILIYQTPRKDYEDFFDAIHRRDDSFYFVSFSGDHLLLPAIAHNQTLRPRMSFVMPAMILNDSVEDSDDHISMMQIDCEVMDTKLVYIKESVIPPHLRQKHTNSSKPSSKSDSKYNRQQRRLHAPTMKLSHQPQG